MGWLAIGVTVVGMAAILLLLGILGRQLGLWAQALNWMRASNEEKTSLCQPAVERTPTNGRPYLLDNDLDWISLWPRSGSYKRFSNLDDMANDGGPTLVENPPIPPQPLRPAPGPPQHRPWQCDINERRPSALSGGMGMIMGLMMGGGSAPHHDPQMDRKGSIHSMRNRNDAYKEYAHHDMGPISGSAKTNPFINYNLAPQHHHPPVHHYTNPFNNYDYQPEPNRHFPIHEEDTNSLYHNGNAYAPDMSRRNENNTYNPYEPMSPRPPISPMHNHSIINMERRDYDYHQNTHNQPTLSSSQLAYTRSLKQALFEKQRKLQELQIQRNNIALQQSNYIARYDKMKKDAERIREEERVLHQLRYENDLIRQERMESDMQHVSNAPYRGGGNGFNSNIYQNANDNRTQMNSIINNVGYEYTDSDSDVRGDEYKRQFSSIPSNYDRMFFGSSRLTSQGSRDSPPPPAPDQMGKLNWATDDHKFGLRIQQGFESCSKTFLNWRDRLSGIDPDNPRDSMYDIPGTPPNTAMFTPPNSATLLPKSFNFSSLIDPQSSSLLHQRLVQVEESRFKQTDYEEPIEGNNPEIVSHDSVLTDRLRQGNSTSLKNVSSLGDDNATPSFYSNILTEVKKEVGDIFGVAKDVQGKSRQHPNNKEKSTAYSTSSLDRHRRPRDSLKRKRKRELKQSSSVVLSDSEESSKKIILIEDKSRLTLNDKSVSGLLRSSEECRSPGPIFPNIPHIELEKPSASESASEMESAFNNVPSNIISDTNGECIENNTLPDTSTVATDSEHPDCGLIKPPLPPNNNMGNSPVLPRKSFLAFKGSWDPSTESGDQQYIEEPEEETDNTRRVREYIASLSARLQQLPETSEPNVELYRHNSIDTVEYPEQPALANYIEQPIPEPSTFLPPKTPPASTAVVFPMTPPNSATRTDSQSSTDTPLSAAATWGSYQSWKLSTETPPNSASILGSSPSNRASYSETPPSSAGFYGPTPPNSASSQFPDSPPPSSGYISPPPPSGGCPFDPGTGASNPSLGMLKRAHSCDSVSSDTSVSLADIDDMGSQITGYVSIQIDYDRNSADLEVLVIAARDLVGPDASVPVDSYVRVFLLPDKTTNMQTRVFKKSNSPVYRERFLFALEEEELSERSLVFYTYSVDKFTNTLLGEAVLQLAEIDFNTSFNKELTLTDAGQGAGFGEIMFSLSYLPTAERLTVVVVKAKGLQWDGDKESADTFVKVYVLQNGKKIMKKKTSVKKASSCPLFNEAMIFNIPAASVQSIQLRVTVSEQPSDGTLCAPPVGHVIVGSTCSGKALSHWNQMMSALRKPIGMWHSLRR